MQSNITQQDYEAFINSDIFYILGMNDLSEDSREQMLKNMQDMILKDFFLNELPKYLSEDQMNKIENDMQNGLSSEDLAEDIQSLLPNFSELIYMSSLDFKKAFVIAELRDKLNKLRNTKNSQDATKIETALMYYESEQWVKGIKTINA